MERNRIDAQAQNSPDSDRHRAGIDVSSGTRRCRWVRIDIGGGGFAFNLPFVGAPETGQGGECLADREIRNSLKRHGYTDVRLRRDLGGDHVEVLARDDGWIYSMRLDRCNGEVDRIERLRPTLGEGFGFQFDYGTDDRDEQGDLK